jgi:hypothetical protein
MDGREFKRYGVVPGMLVFEMEIKDGECPPREAEASADGLTLFDRERMQLWVRHGAAVQLPRAA